MLTLSCLTRSGPQLLLAITTAATVAVLADHAGHGAIDADGMGARIARRAWLAGLIGGL